MPPPQIEAASPGETAARLGGRAGRTPGRFGGWARAALTVAIAVTVAVGAAAAGRAWRSAHRPNGGAAAVGVALQPCRISGLRNEVRCGRLLRPLDPERPQARHITVRYVVVPALARQAAPDPVFVLAGGPGQSAVAIAGAVMPLFERLNNRHDLVFVDQRGTGGSSPLTCDPDGADAPEGSTAFAREADPNAQRAVMAHCLRRLEAQFALRHYTTPTAVQDLDAVRAELGARRIDLVGVSYGTRVGLEYLRQFPSHARRLVLDGVAPADMVLPRSMSADNQQALDAVFAACVAERACDAAHPQMQDRWRALLAALPRTVTYADALTGAEHTILLRRDTVLAAVRNALYVPARAAALPAALDAATHGHWNGLIALSGLAAPKRNTDIAMGMHLSVVCSEDMALLDRPPQSAGQAQGGGGAAAAPGSGATAAGVGVGVGAGGVGAGGVGAGGVGAGASASAVAGADTGDEPQGADFGTDSVDAYRRLCADWPRGGLPPGYGHLATSPVPVLLLSGGLDPATPPRHAARVAAALGAKARSVVVANAGHNVLALPCMADVLFRFLDAATDDGALATDTACAAGVPRPPAFALPTSPR